MAERKFDPDEANQYKALLEAELEYIEGQIIPLMKDGELSYAPAFGLTDENNKAGDYETAFGNIWMDVQNLKATLKGMIEALEDALEGHQVTEEVNIQEFNVFSLPDVHTEDQTSSSPTDYSDLNGPH
jgi:hypothetical protein